MTTLALAERVVACKRWRWMDGMAYFGACAQRELRLRIAYTSWPGPEAGDEYWRTQAAYSGCVPDLDDPATLGCLLTLVREAWGHGEFTAVCSEIFRGHCCVTQRVRAGQLQLPDRFAAWGRSEAEALVAALEVAP